MTSFVLNIPFTGQPTSVYKALNEAFSTKMFTNERFTRVSDETLTFSQSITLGVFRLLLDGQCDIKDQDYENHVTLMTLNTKDRGGKGKLDAKLRLEVIGEKLDSLISCECEIQSKGMLSRVELPIEKIFTDKLNNLINSILIENKSLIVIDDYAIESKHGLEQESPIVDLIEEIQIDQQPKSPLWIRIIKLPISFALWPINKIRNLFGSK